MRTPQVGEKFLEVSTRERTIVELLEENPFAETATVKDEEGRILVIRSATRSSGAKYVAIMELDQEPK